MNKAGKSPAALRDIRTALEKRRSVRKRLSQELNRWVESNLTKHERAKFKHFLVTVEHLGDVDLLKAARTVGLSNTVLNKWMNEPKLAKQIKSFLNNGRRGRAHLLVGWAKLSKFATSTSPGHIDLDLRSMAKFAALGFDQPELFKASLQCILLMHETTQALNQTTCTPSIKQFFIDLGKCLSHGRPGRRDSINPQLWDRLSLDIADIILCQDPGISDKAASDELKRRGYQDMNEERFGTSKHRLIRDAHWFCRSASASSGYSK